MDSVMTGPPNTLNMPKKKKLPRDSTQHYHTWPSSRPPKAANRPAKIAPTTFPQPLAAKASRPVPIPGRAS